MIKKLSFLLVVAAIVECIGSDWAMPGFQRRMVLDISPTHIPAGAVVELKVDLTRLSKALQLSGLTPDGFAVVSEHGGQGVPLEVRAVRQSAGEQFCYLRFRTPRTYDRIMLYFQGKQPKEQVSEKANLLRGALAEEELGKWEKTADEVRFTTSGNHGLFRVVGDNPIPKPSFLGIKRVFALPDEVRPGMPVELAFDGFSRSAAMWPLQLSFVQLDINRHELPEKAVDPRWVLVQTVPHQAIRFRQGGKLDPRTKYLAVSLGWINNHEVKTFDAFGHRLPDVLATLPQLEIRRFELRAAYQVTVPGSNPKLYVEGDRPGTWALNMLGRTAPLFNNFPASVWASSKKPSTPERFYWPSGDGTAEFRIKPQWPPREVILIDNGRRRKASFLTLSYNKGKNHFRLKMHDYAKKSLAETIPCEISSGQWTHIALTWSARQGVSLFVQGKRIYQNKTYCPVSAFPREGALELPEYTSFGADCHRFTQTLNVAKYRPFFKGALDSVRLSDGVRYQEDFIPQTMLPIDGKTTAAFDYERNVDGVSNRGARWISGSIFAANVPPRADVLEVENQQGKTEIIRYVPAQIPKDNMPQNIFLQTFYGQLPTVEDFQCARQDKVVSHRFSPGETRSFTMPEGTVMTYVEIRCPEDVKVLKAPMLRKDGEIDPRSFGDIAASIDFSDCVNDHERACKAFDFLISSSDYFTFQGAEFPKWKNRAVSAEHTSLLAINCYSCFECGPLNTIALGLYTNGLRFPAVMTFGNGHLFQQVMIQDKFRVFDLSAQQFFPSRDMDDAASLDDIERDIYLLARTKRPEDSADHFFRSGPRGQHAGMSLPMERLAYSLYPGETFRYYWANNGESNDLNVPGWRGCAKVLCRETWTDMQEETGADNEIGRVVQRPLPHTATGIFSYEGKVRTNHGAFTAIDTQGFCFRIESPYTIMSGDYQSGDRKARFELSWDRGKTWRRMPSHDGKCRIELPLRARHAAHLRVTTANRDYFSAKTFVQLSPRRLTGQAVPGVNQYSFSADEGRADVTIAYRVPGKKLEIVGGYYFGTVPGMERQLVLLTPGMTKTLTVKGASDRVHVRANGSLQVAFQDGQLTMMAEKGAKRQLAQLELRDGNARKFVDVLICPELVELSPAQLDGERVLKKSAERPQEAFKGASKVTLPAMKSGKYLIFSLTRRNNRQQSYMQLYVFDPSGNEWVGARIRNPGTDYYKATYGSGKYSRYRWDFLTGNDTYPRFSNVPQVVELGKKSPEVLRLKCTSGECAGVFLLPADDRAFMYQVIRNLTSLNRADYLFDF